MSRTRFAVIALVAIILTVAAAPGAKKEQCTSAVIHPDATRQHRPVLWKNRDTDVLSNKVVYVKAVPFSYLALVNADATSGRQCYAGLNSAGFAIMNTVAYNLPRKSGEMEDLEGIIMADALRTCRTIEDFEKYIQSNLGPDLGSWANYGLIDSEGQACILEVHNHGFARHDASAVPEKYLVNTNYARSGDEGRGAGYLRFERASRLFDEFEPGAVDPERILTEFSRDLGHVLLRQPSLDDAAGAPSDRDLWIFTRDCINRPSTSAAVVIIGKKIGNPRSLATMWVIPGEPVCAVAVPLWVEAGRSPRCMWTGKDAPMWGESLRLKDIVRPAKEGNKEDYLNLIRLINADGSGFLPVIRRVEREIIDRTNEFLTFDHTPEEIGDFQDELAEKAMAALKTIR